MLYSYMISVAQSGKFIKIALIILLFSIAMYLFQNHSKLKYKLFSAMERQEEKFIFHFSTKLFFKKNIDVHNQSTIDIVTHSRGELKKNRIDTVFYTGRYNYKAY